MPVTTSCDESHAETRSFRSLWLFLRVAGARARAHRRGTDVSASRACNAQRAAQTCVRDRERFVPREPADELTLIRRGRGESRCRQQVAQVEMYVSPRRVNVHVDDAG